MHKTIVYYRALDAGIYNDKFDTVGALLRAALRKAEEGPYVTRAHASVQRVTEIFEKPVITREFI